MRPDHSDLEVIPNDAQGLHVVDQEEDRKQVVPEYYEPTGQKSWAEQDYRKDEAFAKKEGDVEVAEEQQPTRRICGIPWTRRSKYWLIALIILLIVAAAVGGGVGGALGSRNKSSSNPPAEDNSSQNATLPTNSTTPTSTSGPITTTTHMTSPTSGFLIDCPSSNNSIYSIQEGNTEPILFRKVCGESPKSTGQLVVNVHLPSLDDCINRCAAYNTQNSSEIASGDSVPCNSVCYRNGSPGDDWPGNCFGYLSRNDSSGFQFHEEKICDSAVWINQNI